MDRHFAHELARKMQREYQTAGKAQKARILDDFCRLTAYHRKAAIRLLGHPIGAKAQRDKPGPAPRYGDDVQKALKTLWEASGHICSKRLQPFIPELLGCLERHQEINLELQVRQRVLQLSPSTIDRLLQPYKARFRRQPRTHSDAPSAIKSQVPIRTFGEWAKVPVGCLQADLVAHCGDSTEGFYLYTLVTIDVHTGWLATRPVWGKYQDRVVGALENVRRELPFPLQSLHTDNGGEFLNHKVWPWCQQHGIRLSRGRPYRKNDQAYVEQRIWYAVRQVIGYDRYCSQETFALLEKAHRLICLHHNLFQPISKVLVKQRTGAKVTRTYDTPQTAYQRLMQSGVLNEAKRRSLAQVYATTNPVRLRAEIEATLRKLWDACRGVDNSWSDSALAITRARDQAKSGPFRGRVSPLLDSL